MFSPSSAPRTLIGGAARICARASFDKPQRRLAKAGDGFAELKQRKTQKSFCFFFFRKRRLLAFAFYFCLEEE
jgi:hypothetical protein